MANVFLSVSFGKSYPTCNSEINESEWERVIKNTLKSVAEYIYIYIYISKVIRCEDRRLEASSR